MLSSEGGIWRKGWRAYRPQHSSIVFSRRSGYALPSGRVQELASRNFMSRLALAIIIALLGAILGEITLRWAPPCPEGSCSYTPPESFFAP